MNSNQLVAGEQALGAHLDVGGEPRAGRSIGETPPHLGLVVGPHVRGEGPGAEADVERAVGLGRRWGELLERLAHVARQVGDEHRHLRIGAVDGPELRLLEAGEHAVDPVAVQELEALTAVRVLVVEEGDLVGAIHLVEGPLEAG